MNIMMVHLRNIGGVAGGLERVLCQFANEMSRRGHTVSIVIYDNSGEKPYYTVDDNVQLFNIYERRREPEQIPILIKIGREWARCRGRVEAWYERYRDPFIIPSLREVYHEFHPDVILNQYYTSSGFVYASKPDCPVINMLHNEPQRVLHNASERERTGIANSSLVQVLLPCFMEYMKKELPGTPCVWVPNIVSPVSQSVDLSVERQRYTILHVGRLAKSHKRQHLLIEAFARIADRFPQWDVQFWGDGNQDYKKELSHLISKNHLEKRVFLCGTTHDVLHKYLEADLFAFPSASEGFGLALTEAMSVGLPVVAYRSCPACADLIQDERTGLLADDGVDSLAQVLSTLMSDRALRIRLGKNAKEDMKKFSPDKIWNRWENILHSTISK